MIPKTGANCIQSCKFALSPLLLSTDLITVNFSHINTVLCYITVLYIRLIE